MARILVVENDTCIRRVIALWLKRNGHDVYATDSGTNALALMHRVAIDIIVTDAGLSGMSGLEFLETVRSDAMNDRPAIILTSRCDRHEVARLAAAMGAVVYPKPFSPMQLVETIENSMTAGAIQGFTGSAVAVCLEEGRVDG